MSTTLQKTKRAAKAQDAMIERIYRTNCSGMQIAIMRIPALFKMAGQMLDDGASDQMVGEAMVAFVQKG